MAGMTGTAGTAGVLQPLSSSWGMRPELGCAVCPCEDTAGALPPLCPGCLCLGRLHAEACARLGVALRSLFPHTSARHMSL